MITTLTFTKTTGTEPLFWSSTTQIFYGGDLPRLPLRKSSMGENERTNKTRTEVVPTENTGQFEAKCWIWVDQAYPDLKVCMRFPRLFQWRRRKEVNFALCR